MCHFICNHSYFGNIVLVCIMVSSAMLAAEDPLKSDSPRNKVSKFLVHFQDISGPPEGPKILGV